MKKDSIFMSKDLFLSQNEVEPNMLKLSGVSNIKQEKNQRQSKMSFLSNFRRESNVLQNIIPEEKENDSVITKQFDYKEPGRKKSQLRVEGVFKEDEGMSRYEKIKTSRNTPSKKLWSNRKHRTPKKSNLFTFNDDIKESKISELIESKIRFDNLSSLYDSQICFENGLKVPNETFLNIVVIGSEDLGTLDFIHHFIKCILQLYLHLIHFIYRIL